ncbi:hypothetical protein GQ55_5G023700 [Panicum hallii var. hallii]|uniref:Uncharacterized protein n=1 Tax=Panicum hallii var. hallii TaxID=1504633 RepID=A0A2T7DBV0_9POAL|nr:hypothetical protein GQ55_5G023700 [Panicum hallii var. hallii]
MPAGVSSYLAAMRRGRSCAYHKLKKLPPPAPPPIATTFEQQDHHQAPSAAAIQESYHSYYSALGAAAARGRWRQQWQRRARRPRLRISGLARALRRRAVAVGGRVRASVAKVTRRLREGRPYIGDLFAGNYMFMQVAPSPTMVPGIDDKGGYAPFADYYYGKVAKGIKPPAPAAGPLQVQVHHAAAAGVLYKV